MMFPSDTPSPATTIHLQEAEDGTLPLVHAVTHGGADGSAALLAGHPGVPMLREEWRSFFGRPGLRGHRLAAPAGAVSPARADSRDIAGRDWAPRFERVRVEQTGDRLQVRAVDPVAGLELLTEVEALPGGALRARHTVTNTGETPYLVDGLDVCVPAPVGADEILDFSGRHERERVPQRRPIADGQWVREGRQGYPGHDAWTMTVVGPQGFGFQRGDLLAVHVATSGNQTSVVERSGAQRATVSAGELLMPGEVVLQNRESYTTPWIFIIAGEGLDGVAAALHEWQRTLSSHPRESKVTLNVWEAVYFDHQLDRLLELAELAHEVGAERYVLDDGWFGSRRDDTSGLGDWTVSADAWPDGLGPLVDRVRALGLEFGLWFEPEMVNPDSDLYRAHPDWVLQTGDRTPLQHRNQLVLDLTNPQAWQHVRDQVDAVLSSYDIGFVKWDFNRDELDAGSNAHGGAPAFHAQAEAYRQLLADLRERHPKVTWESCAGGGGRIDLDVIEQVQRFWTSDMTDALARQQIQRWTGQLIAPEYLGAHVSATRSHQTERTLSVGFRAVTALFGSMGIEWDLTQATDDERAELASWIALHKEHRRLLHTGRVVRVEVDDPAMLVHGVVSQDGDEALIAVLQLDESVHNRGTAIRLPGLAPDATFRLDWVGGDRAPEPVLPDGVTATGAALGAHGVWLPRSRPEVARLLHVHR
ncbi:alpha-galactosidase [Flexivirga sp. ID2601S]|uniref:alpha-galactosidase n=1 Tax=Flexivirga aerilata TaxID=1656889 RepID=A0A849ALU3_9MICO|nr:alpha-galactosidase [Flexivirga aerilata]NNG40331.1 alpha-galactosidase [Flexivirga aerilata]